MHQLQKIRETLYQTGHVQCFQHKKFSNKLVENNFLKRKTSYKEKNSNHVHFVDQLLYSDLKQYYWNHKDQRCILSGPFGYTVTVLQKKSQNKRVIMDYLKIVSHSHLLFYLNLRALITVFKAQKSQQCIIYWNKIFELHLKNKSCYKS